MRNLHSTGGRSAILSEVARDLLLASPRYADQRYPVAGADAMGRGPESLTHDRARALCPRDLPSSWLEIPDCLPVVGNLDSAGWYPFVG